MVTDSFDPIPVVLDSSEVAVRLRFDPIRSGIEGLDGLLALAQSLLRPRALYAVTYVGTKGDGTVEIGGVDFHSPILRGNLEAANKVFPFIITVGPELEGAATAQSDLLMQYYLEEMANIALESAAEWLGRQLETRYGVIGLSSLSPGSLEDWPLTEQRKLFALFGDTERLIGVRLTDSLLMVPRKSVSGLFFPSEEGFVACRLCERERCPSRKAPWQGRVKDLK